jgi:REP element-mobilizing transposase RayT
VVLKITLLMPDHLHMLIGVPGDAQLSNLIRDREHRLAAKFFRSSITA